MKKLIKSIVVLLIVLIHINQFYGMEKKNVGELDKGEEINKMLAVDTNQGPLIISGTNQGNIIIYDGNNTGLFTKHHVCDKPIKTLATQDLSPFKLAIFVGTGGKGLHRLELNIKKKE